MNLTLDNDTAFLKEAALDYANDVIAKFGGTMQSEMARGDAGSATSCPLARTIVAGLPRVQAVSVRPDNNDVFIVPDVNSAGRTLPLSRDAKEFAIEFDLGMYPDLRLS